MKNEMNRIFIFLMTYVLQVSTKVYGPSNTHISAGKNVTLTCDVRLNVDFFVVWIYKSSNNPIYTKWNDGRTHSNNEDPRFSMEKSRSNYNLHIAWTNLKDSGDYACRVQRVDYTATLTVIGGNPVFISAFGDTFVEMGSDVTLKCRVSGADEVKWEVFQWRGVKKTNKVLAQSTKGIKSLTDSEDSSKRWTKVDDTDPWKDYIFDLTISKAKMSDEGFYKCSATVEYYSPLRVSRYGTLKVNSTCNDPEFYLKPSDNEIFVKSTTAVHCWLTRTSAKVSVRWVKFPLNDYENGVDLGAKVEANIDETMSYSSRYSWDWDEKEERPPHTDSYDLIIKDAKIEDAGTFVCEVTILDCAYRDIPKVAHAKLFVVDQRDYSFETVRNIEASQGDRNRHFRCDTSRLLRFNSARNNQTSDKISWYDRKFNVLFESGKKITKDSRLRLEIDKHGQYQKLWINRVLQIDAGSYYCVIFTDPPIWQEVRLHVYGCPSSRQGYSTWLVFRDIGRCYGHFRGTRIFTYGGAERYCRQFGGHLVMPKTPKEINNLIRYTKSGMPGIPGLSKNYIWIGADLLRGWNTWIWADGSTMHSWQARWSKGPPNWQTTTRRCVKFNLLTTKFESENCTDTYAFVCETTNEAWVRNLELERKRCTETDDVYFECGLQCYWISRGDSVTWKEAVDICKDQGIVIFSSKSSSEIRNLVLMQNSRYSDDVAGVWTGIYRHGNDIWQSVTGWKLDYYENEEWNAKLKPKYDENCISVTFSGERQASNCDLKKRAVCVSPQNYLEMDNLYTTCGKTIKDMKARTEGRADGPFKKRDTRYHNLLREKTKTSYQQKFKDVMFYNGSLRVKRKVSFDRSLINIHDFPWMVKVYIKKEKYFLLKCAGSIISAKHILTAARCLGNFLNKNGKVKFNTYPPTWLVISWGSDHVSMSSGHTVSVQKIILHHNFLRPEWIDKTTNQRLYDVAILEISEKLHTDCPKLRPVCTTCAPCWFDFSKTRCVFVGFGKGHYDEFVNSCEVKNLGDHLDEKEYYYRIHKDDCDIGGKDFGAPVACISTTDHDPQWKLVGVMSSFYNDQVYFTKLSKVFMWMYMTLNMPKKASRQVSKASDPLRPAAWIGVLPLIIRHII